MKHSLLDEKGVNLLLARARALTPTSQGNWGKMQVTDMLYHCNTVHNTILTGKPSSKKPTFKERLLSMMVLQLMKQLPKGIKTSQKFIRREEDNTTFEKEKNRFNETLLTITRYKENINGNHPLLGPLNSSQWRRFIWMHTDHHLRQFGV